MKVLLRAFLVALALAPTAAETQSFNCNRARTADEVLICQDGGLGALDERMASLYARLRNTLDGPARRDLEAEQSAWLRTRMDCGRDAACIEDAYRRRIRELQAY